MSGDIRWERLLRKDDANHNVCQFCGCATRTVREGVNRCPSCGREYLDDLARVRKYLEENGSANVLQVATATGVSSAAIAGFLKEGRVQLADDSGAFLTCARCGCAIRSGKICVSCSRKIDKKRATDLEKDYLESVGEAAVGVKMGGGAVAAPKGAQWTPGDEITDGEWVLSRDDRGSQLIVDLKDKVERSILKRDRKNSIAGLVTAERNEGAAKR